MRYKLITLVGSLLAGTGLLILLGAWTVMRPEPVKVAYFAGKPIVVGTLNGKEAFFLLDTGSDLSILHSRMAKTYGYTLASWQDRRAVQGIQTTSGQEIRVNPIRHATLILGQFELESRFKGMNISTLVASIERKTTFRIVGIIGADMLMKYGFTIDFHHRTVTFMPPLKDPEVLDPPIVENR